MKIVSLLHFLCITVQNSRSAVSNVYAAILIIGYNHLHRLVVAALNSSSHYTYPHLFIHTITHTAQKMEQFEFAVWSCPVCRVLWD